MEAILSTNEINHFSISELNYIRDAIENMNKFNQIEVLRVLNKHNVTLNENKYGIHINLSEIKKEINYVNKQETTLHKVEQQKEEYKNTYFSKDIKDK